MGTQVEEEIKETDGEEMVKELAGEPADSVEDPATLDEEIINRIHTAYNHWHMHGHPEKAAVLMECLGQNRVPPANLIYFGDIQPETSIDPENLAIPPRHGPDSSAENWRKFAKETTDMEPEIIDKMQRKDLISMLEVKKIIPKEEGEAGIPKTKSK